MTATTTTTTNTTARVPAIAVESTIAAETSRVELAHGALTLKFATGETVQLSTVDLSPEILSQALLHGLKQKLVDAAAIARNTDTGASATVADKRDAVMKVLERLQEGQWNAGPRTGEGSGAKGSILLLALMRANPAANQEAMAARVKAFTDAERAALMKNPKLLPHVQAIQAERAAASAKKSGVDSDALLDGLGL